MAPTITRIDSTEFAYPLEDVGLDGNGFNLVYEPGTTTHRTLYALRVHTDAGITGEYVGGNSPAAAQINTFADHLVGRNALRRERHWSELKRGLRKYDRMGIGPVDIALWDLAGKYHDAPIHELLGTYRERLPAYASTYHGDENGGLNSPSSTRTRRTRPRRCTRATTPTSSTRSTTTARCRSPTGPAWASPTTGSTSRTTPPVASTCTSRSVAGGSIRSRVASGAVPTRPTPTPAGSRSFDARERSPGHRTELASDGLGITLLHL